MRFVPYVIAAAMVALALLRRQRRRRDRDRSATPPSFGAHVPFGDTGLVAAREVRSRLRGRLFWGVTLLLLAIVGAAIIIPTIHSSSPGGVTRVGVMGTLPAPVRHDVVEAARKTGVTVTLVPEASAARARAALRSGQVVLVVDGSDRVLVRTSAVSSGSTATAGLAHTVATVVGIENAFVSAGLTPAQAATVVRAKPVAVQSIEPAAHNGAARSVSVVGLVLVFVMLTQYLSWTLMGVLEEKTSRVVEVLLAAVRPIQLLGGKVLGIGLVALLQAGLVVGVALLLARFVGSDLLLGTAPMVVVATLVWLVLGYAFYSWVYAAAGSMSARQDQVQALVLPLSIPIIAGYIVGLTNAGPSNPSMLLTVFAYLPPTAPFGMPVLVAHGQVAWWEFVGSALLSVASTVVVARLAAGIYRRAVLQTGRRLSRGELLAAVRRPTARRITGSGG